MLILTRRVGESLIIGDDIEVVVLGTKGNQTRLGIKAPENISVHRQEIYEKIKNADNNANADNDNDMAIADDDNFGNR